MKHKMADAITEYVKNRYCQSDIITANKTAYEIGRIFLENDWNKAIGLATKIILDYGRTGETRHI